MSDEFENEVELSIQDAETLVNESKEFLKSLYNVDTSDVKRIVSQDDLRNDVSSFVSSQLRNLENQNILKGLLEAELAKKVLAHDLSNDEIFKAYAMISGEKSRNIDSLFKLFIPTQSTPNTILCPATKDAEKESVDLSSSERQSIEKLVRVLSTVNKTSNNNE